MAAVNDDQLCELEALRSIYPTELTIEQDQESPVRLSIQLGMGENTRPDDDDSEQCTIGFELPPTYPEVAPIITLESEDPELQDELDMILTKLNNLAMENVGLPMVFTVTSAAQEELNHLLERMQQRLLDEETRKKLEEDEKERRRLEGTAVTVENFLVWKARFDEEMGRIKVVITDNASRRLTGREQFLKDASLCTSDIRLIEESGEELKIDESLYGDVELDDELLSDDEALDDKE